MKYFFSQLRFVKFQDIRAIFTFLIALPISWFFRLKHKHLWLVCERKDEARDNGYHFFKYLCTKHPEIESVYAIKKDSVDYEKVTKFGRKVIKFGSIKHWVYYLSAEYNISSQKEGKPNAAVCHLLEVYGFRKNRRVYLKHGIVLNDLKWHYYDKTKMWLYICSAERELEYCKKTFGYPEKNITMTGLARFDNLDDSLLEEKTIFIMPTSREWLARPIKEYEKYDDIKHFENTEYYKAWSEFLTDKEFNKRIEELGLNVVFFLHPNMQKHTEHFRKLNTKACIECNKDTDIQTMLKKAKIMITDYSSIYFDFAYMRKSLLCYQFDYEKFREGHYQEGYFSYTEDGFGPVCKTAQELSEEVCRLIDDGMNLDAKYRERIDSFFAFSDTNNCERIYNAILERRNNE